MIAPKPKARPDRVSLWRYWRMFREDVLSAQPERLYRAKMAEFRTPFFRSFLVNEPTLVRRVLVDEAAQFPKSERVTKGLRPLLGASVFVTNGAEWERQRRTIDPVFEGGRVRESFPAMVAAAESAVARVAEGNVDIEKLASHATADVIFRSLFSVPIEDDLAQKTYIAFRAFQREQPVATVSALIPWAPVFHRRRARDAARSLRALIREMVERRLAEIEDGSAPDDLATKLLTATDPETGCGFDADEMIDQVAIFFLAGHETSAALLGWALWLLAATPEWADAVIEEAALFWRSPDFSALSTLAATRNVLRETLRLYPPVPMFVREANAPVIFRKREVKSGDQVVVSPWHVHRHEALWEDPDTFDPSRWERGAPRDAYFPFSKGPRVCPGAGFAMAEAAVLLTAFVHAFRFETLDVPEPVAHLTVRSRDGIRLRAVPRVA